MSKLTACILWCLVVTRSRFPAANVSNSAATKWQIHVGERLKWKQVDYCALPPPTRSHRHFFPSRFSYPCCFQNNMLNRRAFSDLIPENVHGSRRKEEARQSEFLRIGQVRLSLISLGFTVTFQCQKIVCSGMVMHGDSSPIARIFPETCNSSQLTSVSLKFHYEAAILLKVMLSLSVTQTEDHPERWCSNKPDLEWGFVETQAMGTSVLHSWIPLWDHLWRFVGRQTHCRYHWRHVRSGR